VALLGRADTHCGAHTTGVRWPGTNTSLYTHLIAQSSILFYLKLFSLDLREPDQHGFELTTWKMFIPRMRPKDSYFQNYVPFNIIYVVNPHFIPASLFITAPLHVPAHYKSNLTFMLPCIIIDFFLNNQQDALIIQIYSVIKLYMYRVSSLPIIRSFILYIPALVSFMQVFDDRFQAGSGWNCRQGYIKIRGFER